jgi:hypothetical protein
VGQHRHFVIQSPNRRAPPAPPGRRTSLRALRGDLEDRFQSASGAVSESGNGWQQLLAKWDDTLSNALQLAPQKGIFTGDLDAEL